VAFDISQGVDAVFDSHDLISKADERGPIHFAKGVVVLDHQKGSISKRREHERIIRDILTSGKLNAIAGAEVDLALTAVVSSAVPGP